VNDKLESMCKEIIVTYIDALSQHLPTTTKKKTKNFRQVKGIRSEFRTQDLPNIKQECSVLCV
jgi:hypothetical protein